MKQKSNRLDITGEKYGDLVARRYIETDKNRNSIWECECSCGELSRVRIGALRSGNIKRCQACNIRSKTKYNIKNSRLKSIYLDMIRRCYDPRRKSYRNYGGKRNYSVR